ncbi:actin-like ATPase domain-containing protein [Trichodelitschia bisporula]|uniref:Actin-like ATPase domain-containing protein n=1 Tax=Trichodelitschia bisporula TaxID=703511 RepID=A0A6G1HJM4_9PEZI|nr:actin-like ATPase domain-containing protein [Trichodelitschia bisporula]
MINQKNYYTEYLKRDDQYLAFRPQQEENRNRLVREARDHDRALAQTSNEIAMQAPSEDTMMEDEQDSEGQEPHGSKIIVIHPGSQNLRIGFSNDALPKTVPMVIARKWPENESEEYGGEPLPKRAKIDDELPDEPEKWFGEQFASIYCSMMSDLKTRMRNNKRRLLPNSKELVINYNRKVLPETISEHNDPHRIDWTPIPLQNPPEHITGHAALRIPEKSQPRYKLFWPIRSGWLNEDAYSQRNLMFNDVALILEDAIKSQLGLTRRKDWQQYSCCFIIPDLYDRNYVTVMLDMLSREFGFKRVCFMQESLGGTFGAGYSIGCVVDIGAQKTSICCVEDGMCIEESRVNLKYGGADVMELFVKMMLYDHFPYADINLKRRYDFLLAEELKQKFCTMNEAEMVVQLFDFHLRAAGQDTRKYTFKTYDETMLAPMGFFRPEVFDHSSKLNGRRKLLDRSYDIYDGSPNDPYSTAQAVALQYAGQNVPTAVTQAPPPLALANVATPIKQQPYSLLSRLNDEATPLSSTAGSPRLEGTPQPGRASPMLDEAEKTTNGRVDPLIERVRAAEERDRILPIMPLDRAIITSIGEGAKGDDRKLRDFYGGIMIIGGGAKTPSLNTFLETRLRELQPAYNKEIMIGLPPRELDQQLVVWKGGSVFARLSSSGNDSWIHRQEYDMLGAKLLAQKCMWNW